MRVAKDGHQIVIKLVLIEGKIIFLGNGEQMLILALKASRADVFSGSLTG